MASLKEYINSLGMAVNVAQHEVDIAGLELYKDHMSSKEDSTKPKTINVPVPVDHNEYETRQVPISALLNHNRLSLEEVKITTSVSTSWNHETNQVDVELGKRIPKEDNAENDAHETSKCELNLTFKRQNNSEGIMKHLAHMTKTI